LVLAEIKDSPVPLETLGHPDHQDLLDPAEFQAQGAFQDPKARADLKGQVELPDYLVKLEH